jgi:hypothetical protein
MMSITNSAVRRTLFTLNEKKQWCGRVPRSVGDPRQGAERGGDGRALRLFHLDRKTVRRSANSGIPAYACRNPGRAESRENHPFAADNPIRE